MFTSEVRLNVVIEPLNTRAAKYEIHGITELSRLVWDKTV